MKKKVVDIIAEILRPYTDENELEIFDVEFVKEGPYRYLRVYLDKDGGIEIDDCHKASQFLSEKLDKIDPIKENYFLEVSSPGVERPLKRDSDFEKYKGKTVEVRLYQPYEGQKIFRGALVGLVDNKILIDVDGETIEFSKTMVSLVKLVITFE